MMIEKFGIWIKKIMSAPKMTGYNRVSLKLDFTHNYATLDEDGRISGISGN